MKLLLANHSVPIRTQLDRVAAVRGGVNPYGRPPHIVRLYNVGTAEKTKVELLPDYKLPDGKTSFFDFLENTGDYIHIVGEPRFVGYPKEHYAISVDPEKLDTVTEKSMAKPADNRGLTCMEFVLGGHKIVIYMSEKQAREIDAKIEVMQQAFIEKKKQMQEKPNSWTERTETPPPNDKTPGRG